MVKGGETTQTGYLPCPTKQKALLLNATRPLWL
jgi:hypothetical protein